MRITKFWQLISSLILTAGTVFPAFSQNYLINEGFSGGTTPPSGFIFNGLSTYTTSSGSGLAIPSLKFDDSNDQLFTPVFNNADEVSFWMKGYSVDASSALTIEFKQNGTWQLLQSLTGISSTGTIYSFALPNTATQLRFTYLKSSGNIAFDDLKIKASPVVTQPEMVVYYNNQSLGAASLVDLGKIVTGNSSPIPVKIKNTGSATLTISGIQANGDIQINTLPAFSIAPKDSSNLYIQVNTSSDGNKSGHILINSNTVSQPNFQLNFVASVSSPTVTMPAGIIPQNGDFRTNSPTTILSNTSAHVEQYNNGNWVAFSNTLPTTATLYVLHPVTFTGNSHLTKLQIAGNASVVLATNSYLATTQELTVNSGCTLLLESELTNSGRFELQSGSTLRINYAHTNPASQIFAGNEVFDPNSEIIVEKWISTIPLASNSISTNKNGYLFGNLTINTNLNNNWQLCGAGTTYVTAGDFTVKQTGTNALILSGEGVSSVFFGKSVKIQSGNIRLQDVLTTASLTATIKQNLVLENGSLVLSNQVNAGAVYAVNIEGDLQVNATAQLSNNNTAGLTNSSLNFTGKQLQQLHIGSPVSTIPFVIKSGSQVILSESVTINPSTSANAGSFIIEGNASLDFGLNSSGNINTISGNGYFTLAQGGTLYINSPDGIMASGNSGNVQVRDTRRSFHSQAIYHYTGSQAQQTGTGLPSTTSGKIVIINNPATVTLTQNTGISNNTNISPDGGRLEIKQGTFITPEGIDVLSSGKLVMTGGTFKIHTLNTTVPQLTGNYSLSGGNIEFAGNGNQTLRGTTYYHIVISGNNTNNNTSKGISTTTTIGYKLEIKPNAILDITNKTLNGEGGLIMSGGLFRTAKVTGTLPELTGTNYPYELLNGTIELYGTSATQSQSIRGNYGNGQKIIYNNLTINAAEANIGSGLANAVVGSSLEVAGLMRVIAPASLQVASNRSVNGSGNFFLEDGATLFYGAAEGIKKGGNGIYDGNIRVSGTRYFSEKATYGLVGALDMVTGDGLPAKVANLIIDKSSGAVSLSNTLEITQNLTLQNGILKTNDKEVFVSATNPGAIIKYSKTAYVNGNLRRTMLENGTYFFPVGSDEQLHLISFIPENLTGNGFSNILVAFQKSETGTEISVQDKDMYLNTIAEPGVWQIQPNANPAAGSYTVNASLEGFKSLTDNTFGIVLKTPVLTKGFSTLGDNWSSGDGSSPDAGTAGRTVSGGYASKTGLTSFSTMGIGTQISPLPVSWIHFSAVLEENSVKTTWSTATEKDNSHFEVERSENEKLFYKIGEVSPGTEVNGVRKYSFTDKNPYSGISYYRVKQVDFSGDFSYTKVIAVNSSGQVQTTGSVYPNPAINETTVLIELGKPELIEVVIYDLQARKLRSQSYNLNTGTNILTLDISTLTRGTYLIQVIRPEKQETHRLIVQ